MMNIRTRRRHLLRRISKNTRMGTATFLASPDPNTATLPDGLRILSKSGVPFRPEGRPSASPVAVESVCKFQAQYCPWVRLILRKRRTLSRSAKEVELCRRVLESIQKDSREGLKLPAVPDFSPVLAGGSVINLGWLASRAFQEFERGDFAEGEDRLAEKVTDRIARKLFSSLPDGIPAEGSEPVRSLRYRSRRKGN